MNLSPEIAAILHHVKLNEAGWRDKVVDKLVQASVWIAESLADTSEICSSVAQIISTDITHDEIKASVKRLTEAAVIMEDADRGYFLSQSSSADFDRQAGSFADVEKKAFAEFASNFQSESISISIEDLWDSFRSKAIAPLINELGAYTYSILSSQNPSLDDRKVVSEFLDGFNAADRIVIFRALNNFLAAPSARVREFLLCQMTAAFSVSAISLPQSTLNDLSDSQKQGDAQFSVIVDTNFLFSFLELHNHPANDAAKRLIEISQKQYRNMSIRFGVYPCTLDEARENIRANRDHALTIQATEGIIDVARTTLSGVLQKFYEISGLNVTQARTRAYFDPYIDDLITVLESKGIQLFNDDLKHVKNDPRYLSDLSDEEKQAGKRRASGKKAKSFNAIKHDLLIWYAAATLRPYRCESPLKAKYWIATIDRVFMRFDRRKLRASGNVPTCVHPSAIIHMLQFFVPRSDELEFALTDAFKFPFLFQEFDPQAEKTTLEILQAISRFENASDLSPEAVRDSVLNTALRSKINSTEDEEQKLEHVKEAIFNQNAQLRKKVKFVDRELSEARGALDAVGVRSKNQKETILHQNQAIDEIQRDKDQKLDSICDTIAWVIALVIALLFLTSGLVVLFWATFWIVENWDNVEPWAFIVSVAGLIVAASGIPFLKRYTVFPFVRSRLKIWLLSRWSE